MLLQNKYLSIIIMNRFHKSEHYNFMRQCPNCKWTKKNNTGFSMGYAICDDCLRIYQIKSQNKSNATV